MYLLVLFLFLFTTSYSISKEIKDIILLVEKNNPQLKVINERLKIYKWKKEYKTSLPDLKGSIAINDIQIFYKPFDRNIEPMQSFSFGLYQTFPFHEKLKLQGDIVDAEFSIEEAVFLEKKQEILKKAYKTLYKIWLYREKLKLIKEFKQLAESVIKLSNITYSVGKSSQSDILNSQIYYTLLKKKEISLKKDLETEKENLFYIAGKKINIPDFKIREEKLLPLDFYLKKLEKSPSFIKIKKYIKKQKYKIKFSKVLKYPDFTVYGNYFYRAGFNDYVSLGISFTLPFLNKKKYDAKILLEKVNLYVLRQKEQDTIFSLKKEIKTAYIKAKQANDTLAVLNLLLKQAEKSFETVLSEFKVGKKNMVDVLFSLKQILSIKEEILEEKEKFLSALVQIKSILGELK